MMSDLHAFLRSRRSIRRFESRSVPVRIVRHFLETATHAPSVHNDQPWRFAVLTGLETKSHLAQAMAAVFQRDLKRDGLPDKEIGARLERSRRRIQDAPVVIILCMDSTGMKALHDAKRRTAETTITVQSTALAGLQLLQAAHAEGLGGVWTYGPLFTPKTVQATLGLPATWQPQAMLLIGYPAEEPQAKTVKPLEAISVFLP